MGSTNLWLINPLIRPDSRAITLTAGTGDAIGSARTVGTLDEALVGCSLVVDTSVRPRTPPWPMLDLRGCGSRGVSEVTDSLMAPVFSRGRIGLTSEELQKCHYHVTIVTNPEYSLLNLAMVVQTISYEVRMAWLVTQESDKTVDYEEVEYPLVDDLERFYGYLEQALLPTGFTREGHPGQAINKLRRLSTRACPEGQELNTLHGILASIEQQNKSK